MCLLWLCVAVVVGDVLLWMFDVVVASLVVAYVVLCVLVVVSGCDCGVFV